MKKILLYIILFLSGIDGAWALPIEKEGMSIYSPSLKQEVSYSIILPEGYEHSFLKVSELWSGCAQYFFRYFPKRIISSWRHPSHASSLPRSA